MRIENGQIKDLVDPVDTQDGMTLNHATNLAATLPRYYKSGTQKSNVWMYDSVATVSGGTAIFYLTSDGTSSGTPVFTNLYTESINLTTFDASNLYNYSNPVFSADKKTLTLTVNRQTFSSSNALINLVGAVATFLTGVVFTAAANGTVVYLQVKGD